AVASLRAIARRTSPGAIGSQPLHPRGAWRFRPPFGSSVLKPAPPAGPDAAQGLGRTRSFRKHNAGPRLTREQEQRQHSVLQSAWQHFGTPGPVIAFLNARNEALQ